MAGERGQAAALAMALTLGRTVLESSTVLKNTLCKYLSLFPYPRAPILGGKITSIIYVGVNVCKILFKIMIKIKSKQLFIGQKCKGIIYHYSFSHRRESQRVLKSVGLPLVFTFSFQNGTYL